MKLGSTLLASTLLALGCGASSDTKAGGPGAPAAPPPTASAASTTSAPGASQTISADFPFESKFAEVLADPTNLDLTYEYAQLATRAGDQAHK